MTTFKKGYPLSSGLYSAGGDFPLLKTDAIQALEDGTRLDKYLENTFMKKGEDTVPTPLTPDDSSDSNDKGDIAKIYDEKSILSEYELVKTSDLFSDIEGLPSGIILPEKQNVTIQEHTITLPSDHANIPVLPRVYNYIKENYPENVFSSMEVEGETVKLDYAILPEKYKPSVGPLVTEDNECEIYDRIEVNEITEDDETITTAKLATTLHPEIYTTGMASPKVLINNVKYKSSNPFSHTFILHFKNPVKIEDIEGTFIEGSSGLAPIYRIAPIDSILAEEGIDGKEWLNRLNETLDDSRSRIVERSEKYARIADSLLPFSYISSIVSFPEGISADANQESSWFIGYCEVPLPEGMGIEDYMKPIYDIPEEEYTANYADLGLPYSLYEKFIKENVYGEEVEWTEEEQNAIEEIYDSISSILTRHTSFILSQLGADVEVESFEELGEALEVIMLHLYMYSAGAGFTQIGQSASLYIETDEKVKVSNPEKAGIDYTIDDSLSEEEAEQYESVNRSILTYDPTSGFKWNHLKDLNWSALLNDSSGSSDTPILEYNDRGEASLKSERSSVYNIGDIRVVGYNLSGGISLASNFDSTGYGKDELSGLYLGNAGAGPGIAIDGTIDKKLSIALGEGSTAYNGSVSISNGPIKTVDTTYSVGFFSDITTGRGNPVDINTGAVANLGVISTINNSAFSIGVGASITNSSSIISASYTGTVSDSARILSLGKGCNVTDSTDCIALGAGGGIHNCVGVISFNSSSIYNSKYGLELSRNTSNISGAEEFIVMGGGHTISGKSTLSIGMGDTITANRSIVVGNGLNISGSEGVVIGQGITSAVDSSLLVGASIESSSKYSASIGTGLTNTSSRLVTGDYNEDNEEAIFVVGNGTKADDRSNAFEVTKDGSAKVLGVLTVATPGEDASEDSVVTIAYLNAVIADLRAEIAALKGE